ncbi:hypothetical protein [Streptomyces sp. NPDC008139]|uniref:hypothetical protein n=1 Tax=Streptomyces sp. NPDC008139 TaxID=3364814 RepID=UPI0036E52371
MLILGLLLLAGAGAFTGLAIADNTSGGPEYNVSVLGHSIATMNTLQIFCAGLALALIFCLGAAMAMGGGVSHRRKSRKLTEARRAAKDNARERDALAAQLGTADTTATPAGDTGTDYAYGGSTAADSADGSETAAAPRHRHARHLFGH